MAEQWVKLLAHWKGCEVFQNVGCTGPTDLIIVHPELGICQIDVKCDVFAEHSPGRAPSWKMCSGYQVKAPIYVVRVRPDGDFSKWKAQWHTNRNKATLCPPGWENFWDNDNRTYTTK